MSKSNVQNKKANQCALLVAELVENRLRRERATLLPNQMSNFLNVGVDQRATRIYIVRRNLTI